MSQLIVTLGCITCVLKRKIVRFRIINQRTVMVITFKAKFQLIKMLIMLSFIKITRLYLLVGKMKVCLIRLLTFTV